MRKIRIRVVQEYEIETGMEDNSEWEAGFNNKRLFAVLAKTFQDKVQIHEAEVWDVLL